MRGTEHCNSWRLSQWRSAIGEFVIYLIPALLLRMWLWGEWPRRELVLQSFVVVILAFSLSQIIPIFWQYPRRFVMGLGHALIFHAPDSSFPSDHAAVFSALEITLLMGSEGVLAVLTIIAGIAVAWARIFLGVHFPLDMLGVGFVASADSVPVAPLWQLAGAQIVETMLKLYRHLLSKPISLGWIKG